MSKPPVRVAMYTPFTGRPSRSHDGNILDDNLSDNGVPNKRLQFLLTQIEATASFLNQNYKNDHPNTLYLFITPEWYFRPKRYAYSKSEMFDIITELLNASRRPQLSSMLIIPGSIYWGEIISSTTPAGKKIMRTYNGVPVIKNGSLLCMVHKKMNSDIDVDRKPYEKWGMEDELGKYVEENMININRMIEQRFTGTNTNGFFSVEGLNFGIEHGDDHLNKRLFQSRNERGPNYVDVLLLLSVGTQISSEAVVAKARGYVVHCDGSFSEDITNLRVGSNLYSVFYRSNRESTAADTVAPPEIKNGDFANKRIYGQNDSTHRIVVFDQPLTFQPDQALNQTVKRFTAAIR